MERSIRLGAYRITREIVRCPGMILAEATGPDGRRNLLQTLSLVPSRQISEAAIPVGARMTHEVQVVRRIEDHGAILRPDGGHTLYWAVSWPENYLPGWEGDWSLERIASVGASIAEWLADLHEEQRTHPTLSEAALMVDNLGGVIVGSLPIAFDRRWYAKPTIPPPWAPEEIPGGNATPTGDIWRLGHTLEALLERVPPGRDEEDLRSALAQIARALTAPNPDHRPDLLLGVARPLAIPSSQAWGVTTPMPIVNTADHLDELIDLDLTETVQNGNVSSEIKWAIEAALEAPKQLPISPEVARGPSARPNSKLAGRGSPRRTLAGAAETTNARSSSNRVVAASRPRSIIEVASGVAFDDIPASAEGMPTKPVLVTPKSRPIAARRPDRLPPSTLPPAHVPPEQLQIRELPSSQVPPGPSALPAARAGASAPSIGLKASPTEPGYPIHDELDVSSVHRPARRRTVAFLLFALTLLGMAVMAGLLLSARPSTVQWPGYVTSTREVVLRSVPSGADVIAEVDGRRLGQTPLHMLTPSDVTLAVIVDTPGFLPVRTPLPEAGDLRIPMRPAPDEKCTARAVGETDVQLTEHRGQQTVPGTVRIPGAAVFRASAKGRRMGAHIVRCPAAINAAPVALSLRPSKRRTIRLLVTPGAQAYVDGQAVDDSTRPIVTDRGFVELRVRYANGGERRWMVGLADRTVIRVEAPAPPSSGSNTNDEAPGDPMRPVTTATKSTTIEPLRLSASLPVSGPARERVLATLRRGRKALKRGRLGVARRRFRECIELDPEQAECHLGLADTYRRRDFPECATSHYLRYLALRPEGKAADRVRDALGASPPGARSCRLGEAGKGGS